MLKRLELAGFKSFAKKTTLIFDAPITAIVGPNGSGKSNIAEAFQWALGEQSMKSLRSKRGEDLIWGGSKNQPRMNRASVAVSFDNRERKFDLDFDEVVIKREVHRDGEGVYSLNGSQVRLKDIYELLAKVGLGPSGHHIISQGEADRILFASPVERREEVLDALGLKIYQLKLAEALRKLEKTKENIKQVESLRREIAPHLKFLKKQMEQVQKARVMGENLKTLYREYFAAEENYIASQKSIISSRKEELAARLREAQNELVGLEQEIAKTDEKENSGERELRKLEEELAKMRAEKDELSRTLGRIEGQLESAPTEEFIETLADGTKRCLYCRQIILPSAETSSGVPGPSEKFRHLEEEKGRLGGRLEELKLSEQEKNRQYETLKSEISRSLADVRGAERRLFELKAAKTGLESELNQLRMKEEDIGHLGADFKSELNEAEALVGKAASQYPKNPAAPADRESQKELKHKIDRIKFKLEDAGAGAGGVEEEYKEVSERDRFLEREVADLGKSRVALEELIGELNQTLEEKFKDGLEKINAEFQKFFEILFGGGEVGLSIINPPRRKKSEIDLELDEEALRQAQGDSDESEGELGIEIEVSLPRKKISRLEQLSGGERALTSIAILFAMTQVNPPPFLVLDETDAALDEANSRRYADMLEELSKKSQLIIISHNRETMSRAQILYGVTMPADSVSALLSVKFDEAVAIAA